MRYKNLYDFHLHSRFSSDSSEDPELEILTAKKIGLAGMCFTEHNDFDYFDPDGGEDFRLDIDTYITCLEVIKNKYNDDFKVFTGLEQGLTIGAAARIQEYDQGGKLDFIIGSSHVVDNIDPYYPEFWKDKTIKEGIEKYFEYMYECILVIDNFDVYGHLDYITRYLPDENVRNNCSGLLPMDLIRVILKKLIEKGKGIEINTAGIRKTGTPNPRREILSAYRELGGEIITLGSDAHEASHIGCDFDQAVNLLKDCGFEYFTIFSKRKPEFLKLK